MRDNWVDNAPKKTLFQLDLAFSYHSDSMVTEFQILKGVFEDQNCGMEVMPQPVRFSDNLQLISIQTRTLIRKFFLCWVASYVLLNHRYIHYSSIFYVDIKQKAQHYADIQTHKLNKKKIVN